METKLQKSYREPEQLKDILKRVLKNYIPKLKMKPFEAALANEQSKKEG